MEEKVVFKNICVKSDCLANNLELPARVYEQAEHLNFLFNCNEWKWILIVFLFFCMFLAVVYACFGGRTCLQAKINCEQESCYRVLKRDFIYCGIILVLCAVFIFTITSSNNKDVVSHISFAGTLSSAILSVIAIFMTILAEGKNNESKLRMINLHEQLEKISENTLKQIEEMRDVSVNYKKLVNKMDKVLKHQKQIHKHISKIEENVMSNSDDSNLTQWDSSNISSGENNE